MPSHPVPICKAKDRLNANTQKIANVFRFDETIQSSIEIWILSQKQVVSHNFLKSL